MNSQLLPKEKWQPFNIKRLEKMLKKKIITWKQKIPHCHNSSKRKIVESGKIDTPNTH